MRSSPLIFQVSKRDKKGVGFLWNWETHPLRLSSPRGRMQSRNKERWQELCALAVKEQDPEKLVELTGEIVRLLQDKLDRISGVPLSSQPKSSD
jgi:hypothetical protein